MELKKYAKSHVETAFKKNNYNYAIQRKARIDKLFSLLKPGMEVKLQYKPSRKLEVWREIRVTGGKVIQVTDNVIIVQDARGFRTGVSKNELQDGSILVKVARECA
jgi:phage major head subunit gpT-like protein